MSINSHIFPLTQDLPNISPTQLSQHENNQPYCCHTRTNNRKSCYCQTRTSSKKRIFPATTQEPVVRRESSLLPHKNQQWEEINQLLEGCSFQLWDFFLCMWELQILYGCKLRKWCMRACFAFSLKGSPVIICSKFMTRIKVCRFFSH